MAASPIALLFRRGSARAPASAVPEARRPPQMFAATSGSRGNRVFSKNRIRAPHSHLRTTHELGIETRTVEAFEDFGGRDHRVICSVRRRLRVVSVGAQGHDDRLAETLVRWPRAGFRRAIRTTRRCQMLKCSAPIWDIRAGTVRWPAGASRFSRLSRPTRHRKFSLPTRSSQSPGCIVSRIGS